MEKKKKSGVAMINTCKNDTRQHYVPGAKLTYATRIKQMLKQELGYQGKPKIIELLAEEIAIITKECYENDIGVGQIKAIVPSIEDKPNWAQTIEDTKLVTVTLTLMAEEDIEALKSNERTGLIMQRKLMRIAKKLLNKVVCLVALWLQVYLG